MELVRTSSAEMRRRRLKLERHTARIELHTAELDVELQELRGEMQALMESAADALSLDGPELEELFGRPVVDSLSQPEPEPEPEPELEPEPEPEPDVAGRQGSIAWLASSPATRWATTPAWRSHTWDHLQAAQTRLVLAMILHPRLGEDSPAAVVEEAHVLEATAEHLSAVTLTDLAIAFGMNLPCLVEDLFACHSRVAAGERQRTMDSVMQSSAGQSQLELLAQVCFWQHEMGGAISRLWGEMMDAQRVIFANNFRPGSLEYKTDFTGAVRALPTRAALRNAAKQKQAGGELRRLLAAGADLNAVDGDGKTALYWAVVLGRGHAVDTLLEASADPELANNDGVTPMMRAAAATATSLDSASVVRRLLESGASWRARDRLGKTALDHARGIVADRAEQIGLSTTANNTAGTAAETPEAVLSAWIEEHGSWMAGDDLL
jgi:hypothetical protein